MLEYSRHQCIIIISSFCWIIILPLPMIAISNKSSYVLSPALSRSGYWRTLWFHTYGVGLSIGHHILSLLFTSPLYLNITVNWTFALLLLWIYLIYILTLRSTAFIAEMVTPLEVVTLILILAPLCIATSSASSELQLRSW